MYESAQYFVGCIIACSIVVAVCEFISYLLADPRTETPHDAHGKGTRIGNHKDRSQAAVEARSRLAAGRFADGSCDYITTPRSDNSKS